MKIMVIGGGGNLGGKIVTEALNRGFDVTAVVRSSPCRDARAAVLHKSLFDLTAEDVAQVDVLLSAYGSGFTSDPTLNRKTIAHLSSLIRGTSTHFITIGGAGCLYTDREKTMRNYEKPGYPEFLRPVSENLALGLADLERETEVTWTFVCPSQILDLDAPGCGEYMVGTERVALVNADGASYVTYDDLARSMVDFGAQGMYRNQCVTVASVHGSKTFD